LAKSRNNAGRRWLAAGILAYLAVLLAVAGGLVLLHRTSRDRLDDALGERLRAVATTCAHIVDGDSLRVWSFESTETLDYLWLRSRLQQIRRENDLGEVVICDPTGHVVISVGDRIEKGERNVFWALDRGSVDLARNGFPAVSRLYRSGDIYQKSAHVPIFDSDGELAAVLSVEADAGFLEALAVLRRGAVFTGAAVLIFLSLVGFLIWRLQRSAASYRASVMRQENLAAMGRMTAGIAHEIRNPLTIIRGSALHLVDRLREAGIQDETAAFIPEEVDRLDGILRRYLAFGRDEAADLEKVDLAVLTRRSCRLAENELAAAGVTIEVRSAGEPLLIDGDSPRLQQVVLNLLLNARNAMPDGGLLTVVLARDRSDVVLRLIDEGTGLGGRDPETLFEPFVTTNEKGSGLGLAVVRRIAVEHGGTVSLAERPDRRGAVAELRLPTAGTSPKQASRGGDGG